MGLCLYSLFFIKCLVGIYLEELRILWLEAKIERSKNSIQQNQAVQSFLLILGTGTNELNYLLARKYKMQGGSLQGSYLSKPQTFMWSKQVTELDIYRKQPHCLRAGLNVLTGHRICKKATGPLKVLLFFMLYFWLNYRHTCAEKRYKQFYI